MGDRAGGGGVSELDPLAIPALVSFFVLQKQFVAGLTLGATKG